MRNLHIESSLIAVSRLEALAMNRKHLLIAAALVWIGVPASGAYLLFGQGPIAYLVGLTNPEQHRVATSRDTIGQEREKAVIEATRRYLAANPDAPEAIRAGRELAPVEVLNAELKARQANFRVRAAKGTQAQFYEIS
jgi:hypothetical protein